MHHAPEHRPNNLIEQVSLDLTPAAVVHVLYYVSLARFFFLLINASAYET